MPSTVALPLACPRLALRRSWPILAVQAWLVAIDLRGFEHSRGRVGLFTPEAMAEFLEDLAPERRPMVRDVGVVTELEQRFDSTDTTVRSG